MEELINKTLIMTLLGICSFFDIREKKIPIFPMILFVGIHIAFFIYQNCFPIKSLLAALSLGAGFCLFSKVSKGALGIGDGMLAAVCGISLGFYKTLALFFYGFLLTGLTGFLLLIGKRVSRKAEMPMVPFLYLAYGGMCFLGL